MDQIWIKKQNVMKKFWEVKNFLTNNECSEILKKYKSELKLKQAAVYNDGNDEVIHEKRKSSIAFIENIDILDDRLKIKLENLINLKGIT